MSINADKLNKISSIGLAVIDFSAMFNIKSREYVNDLIDFVLREKIKVAVSREFYENYDVVIKSQNEEQKIVANMVYNFLYKLNQGGFLMCFSDVVNSKEIVYKLNSNNRICFIYYKNSEFSENVVAFKDTMKASAIIVDQDGEYNVYTDVDEIIDNSVSTVDPSMASDDYFAINFNGDEGVKVKFKDGSFYTLGTLLGSGGEGSVFECVENPEYVVKIYHKGQLNKLRLKKIFLMEKKQVRYNGICWPEKVAFSEKGEPVGYLMKKISGKALSSIFESDETVLEAFPNWTKSDIIALAIKILQRVQYLHLFGILVGDLRLKNIVIDESGEPSIVDIDSCQIDDLPCPIGFPDFTPPELQHVEFKKKLRTYRNESFSSSVLVFKLLYCGLHPYDQKFGADTIEEEIQARSFPYPQSVNGDFSKIPWGGYDQMWKHTPFQIQSLFYDVFKNDKRYNIQELILMLQTYGEFLNLKKDTNPSLNQISFDCE